MGARDEILQVVREVLAPLVRADGGVLYLVRVEDDQVLLHLGGRFAGCPGNALARRQIIEPAIRAVAPHAVVTVSSGAIVPPGAERLEG
ncbi:MAG: NifU family protein [Polyangiaceae bacterium]|nr:NifU family protein [Polyangiaceae bacterium]MBK8998165.1 NifU family protein [Myxococcales bacterium]MCE7893201.1 NifU family protein [Sorangiineae bacterium PRO1]MCL4748971.1 NifU family protein [Myxococcales bacterium]